MMCISENKDTSFVFVIEKITAFLVALFLFVVYLLTIGPDFYWRDSGELTAASYALGSAHPSGFPLYLQAGKLLTFVPLGNISFRINLFSALCGAASAGMICLITTRIIRGQEKIFPLSLVGGISAGILLGINFIFWRNSVVAEVYTPTVFLLAVCLYFFLRCRENPAGPDSGCLALLCGLGFAGLHATLRLQMFLGLLAAWLFAVRRYSIPRLRIVPFFFCLGVSVVAYLPIVSAKNPALDWGNPADLVSLWDHVMAVRIREAFSDQMFSFDKRMVIHNLNIFTSQLWDALLGTGPVLAVAGVFVLISGGWGRRKEVRGVALVALLIWIGATDFIYSFWINPMGNVDLQNGFACIAVLSILCGIGTAGVAQFVSRGNYKMSISVACVLVCLTLAPATMASWNDKTRGADEGAYLWSAGALKMAQPGSLMLVVSDDLAAGVTCKQIVDGARPDVALVVRQHAWDLHHLKNAVHPGVHGPPDFFADLEAESLLLRRRNRLGTIAVLVRWSWPRTGVLWEPGDGVDRPAAPPLLPGGPLFVGSNASPKIDVLMRAADQGKKILNEFSGEMSRRVLNRHLDACGRFAYEQATELIDRDPREAGKWLSGAVFLYKKAIEDVPNPHVPSFLNMGAALALQAEVVQEDVKRARDLLYMAIRLTRSYAKMRPLNDAAAVNEARYWIKISEFDQREIILRTKLERARSLLLGAEDRGYRKGSSAFLLGVVYARLGKGREAERWFQKAVDRDPGNETAKIYLKRIQESGESFSRPGTTNDTLE